jgi:hypothetical protein
VIKIFLDSCAYQLPCQNIPAEDKHDKLREDKKALSNIKQLAEDSKIKLYIPGNVQIELNKWEKEKRQKIKEYWNPVKIENAPQEIGFNGVHLRIGGDIKYKQAIDKQETKLQLLKDNSLDSSHSLNAIFFGAILLTTDYKHIKKIKKELNDAIQVMRPKEFLEKEGVEVK